MSSKKSEETFRAWLDNNGGSPLFTSDRVRYYIDRSSRWHADGAITGSFFVVAKIDGDGTVHTTPGGTSWRIEADGTVSRGQGKLLDAILKGRATPVKRGDAAATTVRLSDETIGWLDANRPITDFEQHNLPTKWAATFLDDGVSSDNPKMFAQQLRVWQQFMNREGVDPYEAETFRAVQKEVDDLIKQLTARKNPSGSCPKCGNAWHECECEKSMRKNPTSLKSVTRGLHETEAEFLTRAKRLAEGMGYAGVDFGNKPYRTAKFLTSNPKTGAGYRKRWPYSLDLTADEWKAVAFFRGRYDWADALRDADDVVERPDGRVMLHFSEASASAVADALRDESPSVVESFRHKLDSFASRVV